MNIYEKNGWLDIPKIVNTCEKNEINFIFIIGARRTGKTYGIFKHFIEDVFSKDEKVIYMRRKTTQIDSILVDRMNPWIDINHDMHRNFFFKKVKGEKSRVSLQEINEAGEEIYHGEAFSLTSLMNNRGFSGSEFSEGIYDEFIPEKLDKRIKGEEDAFLNGVETISANRELLGKKPFRWWIVSNSNTLDSPLIQSFGLLSNLEKMKKTGQEFSMLKDRGIIIILINKSPISEKKRKTALYKALTGSTDFEKMALDNEFAYDDTSSIQSEDLRKYRLICIVGSLGIYEQKNEAKLYISDHISGTCKDSFPDSELGKSQFKFYYSWVYNYIISNRISYQNLTVKFYLDKIFNIWYINNKGKLLHQPSETDAIMGWLPVSFPLLFIH